MADHEVFYVKALPEIRLETEHFHVCFRVGRACYEFVLRPELYIKAHLLGDGEVAKWRHHISSTNVSRIGRKK